MSASGGGLTPKLLVSGGLIVSCCFSSGCDLLSVHRLEVQQGNALEEDAVDKLEVGMTPEQVRFLLGNPVIHDGYHPDRWDYLYYFDPGDGPIEHRRLTVFFEDERVVRIERPETELAHSAES